MTYSYDGKITDVNCGKCDDGLLIYQESFEHDAIMEEIYGIGQD